MVHVLHIEARAFLRRLRFDVAHSLAIVLTVALSTALVVIVLAATHSLFFRPLPFSDPSSLVAIGPGRTTSRSVSPVTGAQFLRWRHASRGVTAVFASQPTRRVVTMPDGAAREVSGMVVTTGTFEGLGVRPALGRTFNASEHRGGAEPVVVLGFDFWNQLSQDGMAQAIGKRLRLATFEASSEYRIIGVMPRGFRLRPTGTEAFYLPIVDDPVSMQAKSRSMDFLVFARVAPGVARETVEREHRRMPSDPAGGRAATAVRVISLRTVFNGAHLDALIPLLMAAGTILLLACINVSALSMARSFSTLQQTRVRLALGASRLQVMAHVVLETLLLWVGGAMLGLAGGFAALQGLRVTAGDPAPTLADVSIGWPVIVVVAALTLLGGFLSAGLPALRASRARLSDGGKYGGGNATTAQVRSQQVLAIAQIGLVVTLVAAAGVMGRSVFNLLAISLGFDPHNLVAVRVRFNSDLYGPAGEQLQRRLVSSLLSRPGVEQAGWTSELPLSPEARTHGRLENGDRFAAAYRIVDAGYLDAINAHLLAGRGFATQDTARPVVLVNQAFAKQHLGPAPVGARLFLDDWRHVVGVVADVHETPIAEEATPTIYWPFSPDRWMVGAPWLVARIRPAADQTLLLETFLREEAPSVPVLESVVLTSRVADQTRAIRLLTVLLFFFAAVALVVAAAGVFGMTAHNVVRRRQEFAIRLALGATPRRLLTAIGASAASLAVAGSGLGVLGAWAISRWLRSWVYGVDALDVTNLLLSGLTLLVLTVSVALMAAVRSTRVDPTVALRSE